MMKRKLLTGTIAGLIVLGGAIGVGAASKSDHTHAAKKANFITDEEAKKIALNQFGGKLKEIELEKDDGHYVYEIELVLEDQGEIDLDIHAVTGEILEADKEDDDENDHPASNNSFISLEEAVETALKDTPGEVKEAEYDDGHYEIEIKTGKNEVEIKIDANSGKIIGKEVDRKDD
ncbi:PepSY domain-containing protein [Siminovitchia sediminis]|uniref:PepSY domain-containing protein n=1 Tax=Siminovitchia sediminis TaxID=1274353 RepID=A0ABW4KH05_9BACI